MNFSKEDPIAIMFIVLSILICIPPIIFAYYTFYSKKENYTVTEIPNFLTHEECDKLIQIASTQLIPSKVYTENSDDVLENHRTSEQCWLTNENHDIVNKISTLTSRICNKPIEKDCFTFFRFDGFINIRKNSFAACKIII